MTCLVLLTRSNTITFQADNCSERFRVQYVLDLAHHLGDRLRRLLQSQSSVDSCFEAAFAD
eukprot:6466082-Amphidinium_carterae.1